MGIDVRDLTRDAVRLPRAARACRIAAALAACALGGAIWLSAVGQASATVLEPLSIEQMSARSARVVVGMVTAVREDAGTSATGPRTAVDIAVSDTLKGANAGMVTVYVPGGTAPGGLRMFVGGMPSFTVGEPCAVFVDGNDWVMGGYQGKVIVRGTRVPGEGESLAAFSTRVRGAAKGGAIGVPVAPAEQQAPLLSPSGAPLVTSAAGPTVTSVSPDSASAGTGTSITISGQGFGSSQGSVSFYYQSSTRIPATTISQWTDTRIVCQVPAYTINDYAASAGSGDVLVTTAAGLTSTAATSGSASLSVTFGNGGRKWSTNSGTAPRTRVTFRVNPSGYPMRHTLVTAGAAQWSNAGADFAFYDIGETMTSSFESAPDYQNDLMWTSGMPAGIIAQAQGWWNGTALVDSDVCFSNAYSWGDGTGGTMDVESIAMHEMGHWLFLRDLYGPADSSKVMYGMGAYGSVKRTLSAGDIAGIRWIYGAVPDTTPPTTVASDGQPYYVGLASVHLVATDIGGSGVSATYYKVDSGSQQSGTTANVLGVGPHTLEFWSVDGVGNVESPHKTMSFYTYPLNTTLVFRFYNVATGTHFYTGSEAERRNVIATLGSIYRYEGLSYTIDTSIAANSLPLYRFYNMRTGTHFYTASEAEKNNVVATMSSTYHLDGVAYTVSSYNASATPVYRFYNVRTGTHFYTADGNEKASVIANLGATYRYEGPAFYISH